MNQHPSPEFYSKLTADECERLEFLREQFRQETTASLWRQPQAFMVASLFVGSILPAILVFLWADRLMGGRVAMAGLLLAASTQIMLIWGYGRATFGRSDRLQRAGICYSNYVFSLARKYGLGD